MSTTKIENANVTACCGPTCCGDSDAKIAAADVKKTVREQYGATATSGLSSRHDGVRAVAQAFGYTSEELASIPAEANMGLSCGNPTAMANLEPGEVVVDLGCGGGLDVFLAAGKVGPTGKVIGIDMTPEMIALARKNAKASGIDNAKFILAEIDHLPVPDASVDVVISNCVINLAADKQSVFREIARILKPGGRLAISDIALKKALPPDLAKNLMAYVGCIAGAVQISEYESGLRLAGFVEPTVIESNVDLNAYAKVEGQVACCSPPSNSSLPIAADGSCCGSKPADTAIHSGLADLIRRYDVNDYAASVKVFAVKAAC